MWWLMHLFLGLRIDIATMLSGSGESCFVPDVRGNLTCDLRYACAGHQVCLQSNL